MRYKLLLCALVLLIATPIFSQEFSPIIVETGKPTPSVVRSGEPFKVTYRAKFLDTVLIYEEQMQPDSLALEKIEVIGLEVDKNPLDRPEDVSLGFVNVWDFTYTFRIIQPEKGEYKILPFNFVWAKKKAGVTVEETKDKEKLNEFLTEEVGVSYVSSLVKPPPLDIRDEINFVSPIADGGVLRQWAYVVMGIASLLVVIFVVRFVRHSKSGQSQEIGSEAIETIVEVDSVVVNTEPILLPKQARKKFLRGLKVLQAASALDLTKQVRFLVRALLLSELRGMLRDSMSANEIYVKLSGLDDKHKKQIGWKYAIMLELARRLRDYQENIDSGECSSILIVSRGVINWREIAELSEAVSGLKFHKRVLFFFKRLAGKR